MNRFLTLTHVHCTMYIHEYTWSINTLLIQTLIILQSLSTNVFVKFLNFMSLKTSGHLNWNHHISNNKSKA